MSFNRPGTWIALFLFAQSCQPGPLPEDPVELCKLALSDDDRAENAGKTLVNHIAPMDDVSGVYDIHLFEPLIGPALRADNPDARLKAARLVTIIAYPLALLQTIGQDLILDEQQHAPFPFYRRLLPEIAAASADGDPDTRAATYRAFPNLMTSIPEITDDEVAALRHALIIGSRSPDAMVSYEASYSLWHLQVTRQADRGRIGRVSLPDLSTEDARCY
jgi:hypothetical protein